jgi:hypothetical protein
MDEKLDLPSQKPALLLAGDEAHTLHMVTFEQPDGSSLSLNYRDLRGVRYDPAGLIRLRFTIRNVVLHGRNLLSVWRAFRTRSVRLVRPGESAGPGGDVPRIDSITITRTPRRKK